MPIQHDRDRTFATCEARELTATQPIVNDTQMTEMMITWREL